MTGDPVPAGVRVRTLSISSTVLIAAVLSTSACTDPGLPPDEQREVVIKTAEALVATTSTDMSTDSVEVTDDGTTPRPCPDGGSRYTYAATIGPASWKLYADSPTRAISSTYNSILGRMAGMSSDPEFELDHFLRFDDRSFSKPTEADDPRSATYTVTRGDDTGISFTFVVTLTGEDEVYTDVTAHTRCG